MSQISDIIDGVKSARKSSESIVKEAIERAKASVDFNAVLSLAEDRALERARAIDRAVSEGEAVGRLAGVPFIAKDNFLTFGTTTTAAAKILENFQAPIQATAIERLEAEGAIMIGKANLDAFAHGGSTENSAFGVTKNAIDQTRVAGGSSGGSAVAVALNIVPFTLGSDTGGSIRQPAAFNGVYGIKPTYGAVSRFGVVAMASSTDVIGCFTRNVDDMSLVMDILSGPDQHDMTTVERVSMRLEDVGKLRIGVIDETVGDEVQPEIKLAVGSFSEQLRSAGHTVDHVSLPLTKYALAMYYIIVPAEVSSNLARYDGVRYGQRAENAKTLSEVYGKSRDLGFMTENKRRIMIGSYVLSSGYFDAYYEKAQKARTLFIMAFNKLFEKYDILLTPTTPTTAFKIGANTNDPIKMYLADTMTVPASLAGLPALNIPFGEDENHLPIGMQLIGKQRSDSLLMSLARSLSEER